MYSFALGGVSVTEKEPPKTSSLTEGGHYPEKSWLDVSCMLGAAGAAGSSSVTKPHTCGGQMSKYLLLDPLSRAKKELLELEV